MLRLLLLGAAGVLLVGCGDDESDATDGRCDGACLVFDPGADLTSADHFFDAPYPSDLRLDGEGHPVLSGFPNPKSLPMVEGLLHNAGEARGFPVIPVAHFRFTDALSPRAPDDVIAAEPGSPILLIDLDDASPDRGKLVPVLAQTLEPDNYTPENLLGVAPRPGFVLRPKTRYAVVVRRSALDASGAELAVAPVMARLAKRAPKAVEQDADALYAPLWPVLADLGVPSDDVAAATVFTTGDVVADQAELSTKILEKYDLTIDGLALEADAGAPELCILRGSIEYPQFQKGVPSFSTEGLFEYGADGLPIEQRKEKAPVAIVVPKSEMPAGGYPLVVNIHGSWGWSIAMVRPVDVTNGKPGTPIGPAFPYAFRGFAIAGSAMPLNPERKPGAKETEYLNANNLAAMRDTFRQGQIEQRLFFEALAKLQIPPSALGACSGPTLPAGATHFELDVKSVFLAGQSMGAMYTNQVAAIEPLVRAAVPTGAGGHWTQFILTTPLNGGVIPGLLKVVLQSGPLSVLHPAVAMGGAALEAADPIVYAPRVARRPLPGHPVRSIYEPMAPNDSYFPTLTYDAMALAYGHRQAGTEQWPSMQQALALADLDGLLPFPVQDDVTSETGEKYTGVAIQFEPKSFPGGEPVDGHSIYVYRDDEKHQYSCFLASVRDTGKGRVPALAPSWKDPCQ